jgi:hypothetical protein
MNFVFRNRFSYIVSYIGFGRNILIINIIYIVNHIKALIVSIIYSKPHPFLMLEDYNFRMYKLYQHLSYPNNWYSIY